MPVFCPLVVGIYRLPPLRKEPDFLSMVHEGKDRFVLGPADDPKVQFLAQRLENPLLRAREVSVAPIIGKIGIALLDEKHRPWALTGLAGDEESQRDAEDLLEHEPFRMAVTQARASLLSRQGEEPDIPEHLRPLVERGPGQLSEEERKRVVAWFDRHWSERFVEVE